MNFDFITDRLAVGQTPANAEDIAVLVEAGITHVINCRAEGPDIYDLCVKAGLKYLWDGTEDWIPGAGQRKGVDWFKQGVEFALPALVKLGAKIYVFCHMGANRSATLAWTILRALGVSGKDCTFIIDTHRAIAIPGLLECGWWRDGEAALKELGYI